MKKIFISLSILAITKAASGQHNYCDFEGNKSISFAFWNGQLDTMKPNPATNPVNISAHCGKYIRDTARYDNIVMLPYSTLMDVTPYAIAGTGAPKFQLKVYSSAPAGMRVDLNIGARSNTVYPAGIHSIYSATTTTQHAWELLTFNFVQTPPGSSTTPTSIDKILLFFHPNSHVKDTIYFDDPSGQNETILGIEENSQMSFKLFQNRPNPAKENTSIKLQVNSAGLVSMKLYDVLGKQVATLIDQNLNPGVHTIPVETEDMPDGIYFYVLKKGGITQTRKMIISK
jgi:hypothetical protein